MKKTNNIGFNLQGDNMKKRTIIVVALAIVLALSFATIATAKYAGYAYNNPVVNADLTVSDNPYPGYLSWTGAKSIAATDTATAALQTTAHGGYITTTVKCAVCHSAHRADSAAASVAGTAFTSTRLVSAGGCVNCHTAWGAGGSDKKIEWENLLTTTSADPGGPHHHADPTCTNKCHTGGIHGGGTSTFNGMNAYMLGSDKDAAITTDFVNGNVGSQITYTAGGGTGTGANWFQSGTTGTPAILSSRPAGVSDQQMAAAKATATGYTCAQAGCHTSGQFAVNAWGFSSMRASKPASSGTLDMPFTGHGTGAWGHGGGVSCGPCHPGSPAGGYRQSSAAATSDPSINMSIAYGCDQCHDLVGRATNTTAWPHGNRAIDVYEWQADGTQTTIAAADLPSGNIWMYKSDISTVDAAGYGSDRAAAIASGDRSFTLMQETIYHGGKVGNISDGVCLKCHIPVDSKSIVARGGTNVINVAGRRHSNYIDANGNKIGTGWAGNGTNNSNRIFIWK